MLNYPSCIIPKTRYIPVIELDTLLIQQELLVLRRSSKPVEDTFNEIGLLREDAIVSKDITGLSMNLLGSFFKVEHIKFVPKIKSKGSKNWPGTERVYLSEYIDAYSVLDTFSPIFFKGSDLINITIPYTKPKSKEAEKLLKSLKLKYDVREETINAKSRAILQHVPTYLNYWHVELSLFDFNDSQISPKNNNQFTTSIITHILTQVLSVKGMPDVNFEIVPITPLTYKKKNFQYRVTN